eukprot:jgi/Psemu1/69000/estExt_Genemark1.C_6630007
MGLFRKKQRQVDNATAFEIVEVDDNASIPREVRTKGGSKTSRSLGKLLCGSSTNKAKDTHDEGTRSFQSRNNIDRGRTYVDKADSSTTSSGSSSSGNDARDDRPHVVFHASTSKSKPEARANTTPRKDANSLCSLPPPAARSAFDGPPRFDWIDIEYNAATMIQAVFRRYIVLHAMEQRDMTTSFIRNRKRERKAKNRGAAFFGATSTDTAPDLGFGCCVGFDLCGSDFNASDMVAYRTYQRKQYLEKKKEKREREEFVRRSYLEQRGLEPTIAKLEQEPSRDEYLRSRSKDDFLCTQSLIDTS